MKLKKGRLKGFLAKRRLRGDKNYVTVIRLVSPNVFTLSGANCIGKDSAYEPSTKILIFVIFHLMVWRRVSN